MCSCRVCKGLLSKQDMVFKTPPKSLSAIWLPHDAMFSIEQWFSFSNTAATHSLLLKSLGKMAVFSPSEMLTAVCTSEKSR